MGRESTHFRAPLTGTANVFIQVQVKKQTRSIISAVPRLPAPPVRHRTQAAQCAESKAPGWIWSRVAPYC